ncbi:MULTISPECIES: tRNA preQ1(34) S-adenosylmethionine ribosyltransferase-isomerase QueA [unclassified Paenibacillus]|uniref:tRNA preQ1(34) S-adenosylmethionine ribosyltransferase-isomerase QueA n=1 Tax=unclassified Paenibacillus TaxID=185978 RepID=UPI001AE34E8F|nr:MULTISPECIES: tRNA preQ1(34) S-adenosylmethionine ribosyltransferase-isomerase QueA [unclassified Paenibacillus]MBP1156555.1 S-adenosylmethionine:tRNA ribosyltransferase-isomerase [Paenibacillus sp. PvP091]MBP1172707.1 S-adenosylmethionine:tRNA ribosyltransferase-isomerase [Paenibacillus sp. PvR098]MBP2439087.1 S-adenosylmethionine:tRNA ribosyltransferase-isomerase [Paenibacillus sp. PvP052]
MQVELFDYNLPESLIAQTPLADRTASRLLTLDKRTGQTGHHGFAQLEQYLQAGDVLVLNDTRVIPARLFGVKADTGAKAEVLLLKPLEGDRWEALVRPAKRLKAGARLHFGSESGEMGDAPLLTATVESEGDMGSRVLHFSYSGIFHEILERLGQMPLPPYIKEQLPEKERYQTVYAKHRGSAAAPTAGLHFTEDYLHRLEQKGIQLAYVTLHVGLGTFRPVSAETVEEHEMHEEYYEVSERTAEIVNAAKRQGGRIVAVGTTSARTLESAAREDGTLVQGSGWTGIFIYPGYSYRLVDALLTNFHLPKSTLMMLISALAGREHVLAAYKEAVEREYRFFSFGDAMFIY